MSKILEANCGTKIVTSNGVPVDATIFSEGNGASEGVLLLDEDKAFFLNSSASDIKTILEKIGDFLSSLSDALTTLDTAGFNTGAGAGSVASPPIIADKITEIQGIGVELNALKGMLK